MVTPTYENVFAALKELYPVQLAHAHAEARARLAEQRLAELENGEAEDE